MTVKIKIYIELNTYIAISVKQIFLLLWQKQCVSKEKCNDDILNYTFTLKITDSGSINSKKDQHAPFSSVKLAVTKFSLIFVDG